VANELRVRSGFLGGLIEDNPLSSSATTLTSAGLASVPVIASTQHLAIVLDPDGFSGSPEIVYITAHSAAATTATIVRAQEGSTARSHDRDVPWVHSVTVKDFDAAGGGTGLIGLKTYMPSLTATATSSTTHADVDATNLAVSFTVPPSGSVLVSLCAVAQVGVGTTLAWSLREASADVVTGEVIYSGTGTNINVVITRRFVVTGLVAGAAKTYKWGHARAFGSNGANTAYGGANGIAVMEVWAVNL
jgi:hypothetical protein